jgi:predicted GH43/DUF377 family glycosyl hydrolase
MTVTESAPSTDLPPTALVRRGSLTLRADPARVVAKLFLPGQETLANGISRADQVIQRVFSMTDEVVSRTLDETRLLFADRHHDLDQILARHYQLIAHRVPAGTEVSCERQALIGTYFTQEYSVEAAALFNPSMVAHPDQSGLGPGEQRFLMSVRAVGEGHISSVEFRTGVLTADTEVLLDDPGRHLSIGQPRPRTMSRALLAAALAESNRLSRASDVLDLLPAEFGPADLDLAITSVHRDRLTRGSADAAIERIRWIVACNYRVQFDPSRPLGERALFPVAPDEGRGVEDVRLTRFTGQTPTYLGTYTAFDGVNIAPHLIQTDDFVSFEITRLVGVAAKNKGMAIFPRPVGGDYLALSRWDRESIGIARSADGRVWNDVVTVQTPVRPWEVIQLGNCGPPIETDAGWLVLTHGVGPMRGYALGATLLDLDDPTVILGGLDEPLLVPSAEERDGYVPNVVYSCGGLVHRDTLVVPYGCSDSTIRFAFVDLPGLLRRMTATP